MEEMAGWGWIAAVEGRVDSGGRFAEKEVEAIGTGEGVGEGLADGKDVAVLSGVSGEEGVDGSPLGRANSQAWVADEDENGEASEEDGKAAAEEGIAGHGIVDVVVEEADEDRSESIEKRSRRIWQGFEVDEKGSAEQEDRWRSARIDASGRMSGCSDAGTIGPEQEEPVAVVQEADYRTEGSGRNK
jgi:hypothetical protein